MGIIDIYPQKNNFKSRLADIRSYREGSELPPSLPSDSYAELVLLHA